MTDVTAYELNVIAKPGASDAGLRPRQHVRGAIDPDDADPGPAERQRDSSRSTPKLENRPGWDGIDEMRAAARGWRSTSFADLVFFHHRIVGRRDQSRWRRLFDVGRAAHYTGYRPSYLVLRSLFKARKELAEVLGKLNALNEGAVALADKMDDLAGCFGIGLIPTGSKDPFALRRAAQGVVKILVEGGVRIPLDKLTAGDKQLQEFLLDRVRYYFRDVRGYKYDEVNAVLAAGSNDLVDVAERLEAIKGLVPTSLSARDAEGREVLEVIAPYIEDWGRHRLSVAYTVHFRNLQPGINRLIGTTVGLTVVGEGLDDPVLAVLDAARAGSADATVSELVLRALEALDLYGVCGTWPDAVAARANLLRLQGEAAEFQGANPEALASGRDSLFSLANGGEEEVFHVGRRAFELNGRRHDLTLIKRLTPELRRQEVDVWKRAIRTLSHEINNSLAPIKSIAGSLSVLIGRDPFDVTGIHRAMDRVEMMKVERLSHWNPARAAIDIALYDVIGRYLGVPVYDLLGGRQRDRFEVCKNIGVSTPEETAVRAQELVAEGYTTLKLQRNIFSNELGINFCLADFFNIDGHLFLSQILQLIFELVYFCSALPNDNARACGIDINLCPVRGTLYLYLGDPCMIEPLLNMAADHQIFV